MSKKHLKIHTENILPIIKQWLYTEKDIFVRELVANACDATAKLKVLSDRGEAKLGDGELRIDIVVDKEKRTLTFADHGIGMSAEEVEKYIGEVAFSGAEEFVKKYQSDKEGEQIIGHFGLGFFSAFMVAGKVEIETKSFREEDRAAHWSCDGSSTYEVSEGSCDQRGTTVTLHLSDEEYLDENRLKDILKAHCAFLPVPIYLNEERINEKEPLWVKPASECTEEEYRDFYRQLYPMDPEPLFWVHLNVDYPFNLRGILYFPKLNRDIDYHKNSIKLFCNRVFVSDNCKDLIPDYLMVLRGAIDSPDIPLNVSRSTLQMDRTVRSLAGHISKKVSDRLVSLCKTERESYLKSWEDLELIVKLGVLQDEKFYERVKEALVWKSVDGEWMTLEEYLERNEAKHANKVFYAADQREASHFLQMYKEKGIEVLVTRGPIDTHMISFLERQNSEVKFQRIDGAIDEVILDGEKEKTLLDEEGKTQATRMAEFVKRLMGEDELEVEAKSLTSENVPAFVMIDEQQRRMRDLLAVGGQEASQFMGKRTLVVNTNSKLMQALEKLHGKKPKLASQLLRQVHDQALIGQRELKAEELDTFLARNNEILQELTEAASAQE